MVKNFSLPTLRRFCGFTQRALAKKIGVSFRTIVSAENGVRPLTEENARKIMFATGVLPKSLLREDSPRALGGRPYSSDDWDAWRDPPGISDSEDSEWTRTLGDGLKLMFGDLVDAAAGSGRTFLVAEEFRMMLSRLLHDPKIERRYSERWEEGMGDPEFLEQWILRATSSFASELREKTAKKGVPPDGHTHSAP